MERDISEELGDWFYLFGVGVLILSMIILILCYVQKDLDYKIGKPLSKGYDLFIDGKEVFHNSNGCKVTIDNDKKVVNFESIQ